MKRAADTRAHLHAGPVLCNVPRSPRHVTVQPVILAGTLSAASRAAAALGRSHLISSHALSFNLASTPAGSGARSRARAGVYNARLQLGHLALILRLLPTVLLLNCRNLHLSLIARLIRLVAGLDDVGLPRHELSGCARCA